LVIYLKGHFEEEEEGGGGGEIKGRWYFTTTVITIGEKLDISR